MFSKIVLAAGAVMFLVFGLLFLVIPERAGSWVHLGVDHPVARTELRAFYGGLELGLACFLFLCLFIQEWRSPGLVIVLIATGGPAAGRILGIFLDRSWNGAMGLILLVEAAFAVAAAQAWLHNRAG